MAVPHPNTHTHTHTHCLGNRRTTQEGDTEKRFRKGLLGLVRAELTETGDGE